MLASVVLSGAVLAAEGLSEAMFVEADALFVTAGLSDELLLGEPDAIIAGATAIMFVVADVSAVILAVASSEGMLLAVEVLTSAGAHESCVGNFVVRFCSFSTVSTVSQAAV